MYFERVLRTNDLRNDCFQYSGPGSILYQYLVMHLLILLLQVVAIPKPTERDALRHKISYPIILTSPPYGGKPGFTFLKNPNFFRSKRVHEIWLMCCYEDLGAALLVCMLAKL